MPASAEAAAIATQSREPSSPVSGEKRSVLRRPVSTPCVHYRCIFHDEYRAMSHIRRASVSASTSALPPAMRS